MNRRHAILLGGTALATALSGCLGNDDPDVDFDDPEAVAEVWVMSLVEPDYDVMRDVIHENIQRGTLLDLSREDRREWAGLMERYDRTVRETSVVEELGNDRVIVAVKVTDQTLSGPTEGTLSYVLKTEDGGWKIYDTHEIDISGMDGAM